MALSFFGILADQFTVQDSGLGFRIQVEFRTFRNNSGYIPG